MSDDLFVRPFATLGLHDLGLVGGKNASLGELYNQLTPLGVAIPNGFAVTAAAYHDILGRAKVRGRLRAILGALDPRDVEDLAKRAREARGIVYNAPFSEQLKDEILDAYTALGEEYGTPLSVAVRSSGTAEDLPSASFAGLHDTYLNVTGVEALFEACHRCFASLFTDRAIHYRAVRGFDHFDIGLSVGVMKMVRSDLAASGVIFTLDTESGFRDVVLVTGSYGLGENIVQGTVNPDEFMVFKPTFASGHRTILRRNLGTKALRMVYSDDLTGEQTTRNVDTSPEDRERFCLSDQDVLVLADDALAIEGHYSESAGHWVPMDIEWAKDGLDGKLYVLQARPETVASQRADTLPETYTLTGKGPVLATGRAVGVQVATGRARLIADTASLASFLPGEILIADVTSPDWEPVLKKASGVVTNRGGRTCHAAIVARELGIPAVVGTEEATEAIAEGAVVTVSCAEGDTGHVYAGEVPFSVDRVEVDELRRPMTQVMVNLADPDRAFRTSQIACDGVGLARLEFIITQMIGIHPMALAHPERIRDSEARAEVLRRTRGYEKPEMFFVERLSEGVGTIAAAFYPKPVIVRLSDFKSNEYAALLGGQDFEPHEENPMLGFRGASRYAHPRYEDGFALECAALKRCRDEMGLANVRIMVPFCRRVQEAERVLAEMAKHGLVRGESGLEVYVMCEVPNNVIQLDAFAAHFDGFSIGSNDLTQLVLGVDRDSELVAFDFDERDPGVREMMRLAIEGCRRNGVHSGICGQAPSDYPEITEFLVEAGIDSISVSPDALVSATRQVLEIEDRVSGGTD